MVKTLLKQVKIGGLLFKAPAWSAIRQRQKAQGMVEFALVLPILLMLLMGIIAFSHLFFVYSLTVSASREAARWGAAVGTAGAGLPRYRDCLAIAQAAVRAGSFAGIGINNVDISYDHGPGTAVVATCPVDGVGPAEKDVSLGDRLLVTINVNYQSIVPFVNIPSFPVQAQTARTIVKGLPVGEAPIAEDPCGKTPQLEYDDADFPVPMLGSAQVRFAARLKPFADGSFPPGILKVTDPFGNVCQTSATLADQDLGPKNGFGYLAADCIMTFNNAATANFKPNPYDLKVVYTVKPGVTCPSQGMEWRIQEFFFEYDTKTTIVSLSAPSVPLNIPTTILVDVQKLLGAAGTPSGGLGVALPKAVTVYASDDLNIAKAGDDAHGTKLCDANLVVSGTTTTGACTWSWPTTTLQGVKYLWARFNAVSGFKTSYSVFVTQVVQDPAKDTITTLTANGAGSNYIYPVLAKVVKKADNQPIAVPATVDIYDSPNNDGSYAVKIGTQTLDPTTSQVAFTVNLQNTHTGNHYIYAAYPGNANFNPSDSHTLPVTLVGPPLIATRVVIGSNPATDVGAGKKLTITAQVVKQLDGTPLGAAGANGTLVFYADGTPGDGNSAGALKLCGPLTIDSTSSTAVCEISTLARGTHTLWAYYAADGNGAGIFTASFGSTSIRVTDKSASKVVITSISNQAPRPHDRTSLTAVVYDANISPNVEITESGTVRFYDGASFMSGNINGGAKLICTASYDPATKQAVCSNSEEYTLFESHTVWAYFEGSATYDVSYSAPWNFGSTRDNTCPLVNNFNWKVDQQGTDYWGFQYDVTGRRTGNANPSIYSVATVIARPTGSSVPNLLELRYDNNTVNPCTGSGQKSKCVYINTSGLQPFLDPMSTSLQKFYDFNLGQKAGFVQFSEPTSTGTSTTPMQLHPYFSGALPDTTADNTTYYVITLTYSDPTCDISLSPTRITK